MSTEQNTHTPSVIEKFRRQRQRMQKIMLTFVIAIVVMVAVPLVLRLFPGLGSNPAWRGFGNAWVCLFGILCTTLGVAAWLNQGCPACGKPVQEFFWSARHCPNCGAKLSDD